MVSLKALAKAAKITVSQLTIRLRKHELSAAIMENPEEEMSI